MLRRFTKLLVGGLSFLPLLGCGNRHGNVVAVANPPSASIKQTTTAPTTQAVPQTLMVLGPSVRTFQSKPAAIQFDYPTDWVPDKAKTACFAIHAPLSPTTGTASLCLDIPKLPWHLAGMITVNMIAGGYESDLKKNQIPDAVTKEDCPVTACGCTGRRITSCGHQNGKPSMDIAVIFVHADQVFIISADSDDAGYDMAKKALDDAVASVNWAK